MNDGVAPLTQVRRDLAATARNVGSVLDVLARHRKALAIAELAERSGLEAEDVRSALYALEHIGLCESSHFRVTDSGIQAAKE